MRWAKSILFLWLVGANLGIAAPEPNAKVPIVYAETAKRARIFDELSYPARIVPLVEATILSEGDGVINRLFTPLGTAVKAGELMMTVRNTDPIYQYAPLKTLAPVTGVVSSVEITEGSWVTKGQRLATVVDPTRIKITIEVSGEDLSAINPGLRGRLTLPGQDTELMVRVRGISPFVDAASGTATCELSPDSKVNSFRVRPGLVGKVAFHVREHQGVQVTESAVVYRGDKTYLRILEGDRSKLALVKLGELRRGLVEVTSGIAPGKRYILRSSTFVADGDKVSVQTEVPE